MATARKVAAVIVNYNGGLLLGQCLQALEAQTLPPHRIIVVDNASSDGSVESIIAKHSTVQVLRCTENLGFAKANNLGISAAEDCEWVACLNPDAFPEPDWLERLMRGATLHEEFHFFGCTLVQTEHPDILDGTGDVYHVSGLGWRRDHGKKESQAIRQNGEIFAPCAAAALYRRDMLLEVGGFDESFFCYFEDVDLAFRLRLKGYRCYYVSSARVHHVGSAITGRRSDFSIYHGHRNLVWAYFKNMPSPLFWLYLPLHIALNVCTIIAYSVCGRAGVILRAKRDALAGLQRILVERKTVQGGRRIPVASLNRVMSKSIGALLTRK